MIQADLVRLKYETWPCVVSLPSKPPVNKLDQHPTHPQTDGSQ